jgi:hypothetical protein
VTLLAFGTTASAQCSFDHPKKAQKFQGEFVQAFVSCGNPGGNTPNTTTEGGVPGCAPPETFNEAAGNLSSGWRWDPLAGQGKLQLKAKKACTGKAKGTSMPACDPADTVLNPPGHVDLEVALKLKGVVDADGPATGLGELAMLARLTMDDWTGGDMTIIDFPVHFPFDLKDGKAGLKSSADALLNSLGVQSLPACTNLDIVNIGVLDENGNRFANLGLSGVLDENGNRFANLGGNQEWLPRCEFERPKQAKKFQGEFVQAFVSCGNVGGNTPNTATEGGIPSCKPPETQDDDYYFGFDGAGRAVAKLLKRYDAESGFVELGVGVGAKVKGVRSREGGGSLVDGIATLRFEYKLTVQDPFGGDMTIIPLTGKFDLVLQEGKGKVEKAVLLRLPVPFTKQCLTIDINVIELLNRKTDGRWATLGIGWGW